MKRLLRGIIDFNDQPQETLEANFQRLRNSRIEWLRPADGSIYTFVKEFVEGQQQIPGVQTFKDFFERANNTEVLERLKDIEQAPFYDRANFTHLLKQLLEEQGVQHMRALLKETDEIVSKGLTFKEGRENITLKGVKDAALHFNQRVVELIPEDYNAKTRGDVRDDVQVALDEYEEAKRNKGKVYGKFTGIDPIDEICHGIKKGELWLHAAFPGELKTTFALNWCYNLVTRYRTNVFYVSLEMPYTQLRRGVHVLHTTNNVFKAQGKKGLDYRKVRDGELGPEEEAFYKEALHDFDTNPNYCRFEIWCPDRDVTIDDIRIEAEMMNKQMEIGLLVIDHGGLVDVPRHMRNKDYTIALNSVLRSAKKLALHFDGGKGLAVLMLFQINRQGKDDADKNDGVYKIKALNYANEAEKSSDYITTTYLNQQLRDDGETRCCNLKNRDNPLFNPFNMKVNFGPRRLTAQIGATDAPGMTVEDYDGLLENI